MSSRIAESLIELSGNVSRLCASATHTRPKRINPISRCYSTDAQTSTPKPRRPFSDAHPAGGWMHRSAVSSSRWNGPIQRSIHSSAIVAHGDLTRPKPGTGIKVNFKDSKGNLIRTVEANEGDDILSIAHEHDIDLEGACEASLACSTCHIIVSPEHYDLLPEPEDDENDMLDMAFGLTDTSRLGCQVRLTRELDGMTATLPSATRNMFVDGKKPTHH